MKKTKNKFLTFQINKNLLKNKKLILLLIIYKLI